MKSNLYPESLCVVHLLILRTPQLRYWSSPRRHRRKNPKHYDLEPPIYHTHDLISILMFNKACHRTPRLTTKLPRRRLQDRDVRNRKGISELHAGKERYWRAID